MSKVETWLKELSTEEKISLLSGKDFWHFKSFPQHSIPEIMVADGPHGLRKMDSSLKNMTITKSHPATCFPTAVTLASSWDRDLINEIAIALAKECLKENISILLGPGINIKRHPLCGRNFEYFSEDPILSGELGAAFINGTQSMGIGTSLKHFAANNQEYNRNVSDSIIDERTLREIYLRAFEISVKKSQPWTVMCSYNLINGTYSSDNKRLLNDILRKEWKFEGIVLSDWGATNNRVQGIKGGLDVEMPGSSGANDVYIKKALNENVITMDEVNKAAERILKTIEKSSNSKKENYTIDIESHHSLARRAAAESMVLLRNENNILPLSTKSSIAIIGELAQNPRFQGNGSSLVNPYKIENPLTEISKIQKNSIFSKGYSINELEVNEKLHQDALETVKDVDVVLFFGGLPPIYESETFDRDHIKLPENQRVLIEDIAKTKKNIIVVLSNGAPVEMPWINKTRAIIEAYLGGQASGGAIADIIFGTVNPSGKLAETFPLKLEDCSGYHYFPGEPRQVQYREGLYVGYRYFSTVKKPVLFPFGFGLSYSSFEYSNLILSKNEITEDENLQIKFTITNTSSREGKEIVQIYIHDNKSTKHRPHIELKDFKKINLKPQESKDVEFILNKRSFAFYDIDSHNWQIEEGDFTIMVGASCEDIRLQDEIFISSSFTPAIRNKTDEFYTNLPVDRFIVSDDIYKESLQRDLPSPLPHKPYHINSTIGDIRRTFLGSILYHIAIKTAAKMWGDYKDPTVKKIVKISVKESPLRSLFLMSNGIVSYHMAQGLIDLLNKSFFKGIAKIFSGLLRNKH